MELTVQELAKLEQTTYLLIDMRSGKQGPTACCPGAIPVLPEDLSLFAAEHPDKTLVLYCARTARPAFRRRKLCVRKAMTRTA